MNKIISIALIAGALSGAANAAFSVGITGSERGIDGFSLSIGDYYRVPHNEIMVIQRSVPREEMSVVYFLARQAHRDARFIADLRLHGLSWWDISLRLGLDPYILYAVNTQRHYGPPYGVAYGYDKPGKYRLRDSEIINLVNVRFLSDYHRIAPDDVINRRRSGERFMNIDDYYRQNVRHIYRNDERKTERYQREERSYHDERNDRNERRYDRNQERYDNRGNDKGHGNSKGNRDH